MDEATLAYPGAVAISSHEVPLELPDKQPPAAPSVDLPDRVGPVESSYSRVAGMDPQRSAQIVSLARRLQQPEAFIDKNLGDVKMAADTPPAALFHEIETSRPVTSRTLQDPGVMASTKDDLDNLTMHERLVNVYHSVVDGLSTDWNLGKLHAERAMLGFSSIPGIRNVTGVNDVFGFDSDARLAELDKRISGYEGYGPLGFGEDPQKPSFLRSSLSGAIQLAPMLEGGVKAGLAGGAAAAVAAGGSAAAVATGASLFAPPALAVAPAAAALAAGAAAAPTGFTAGEAYYNFKYFSGQAYLDLRSIKSKTGEPIPENVAAPVALTIGAVNAGLGMVQIGSLLNTFPAGKAFLERLTQQAGAKVLQSAGYKEALLSFAKNELQTAGVMGGVMGAQTAVQVAGESYAKSLQTGAEYSNEGPTAAHRIGQSIVSGGGVGLFLGLPGLGYTLAQDSFRVRQLRQAQDFYRAMGDTADASKLRERLPEAHKAYVADLTRDTPVSDVYLPLEAAQRYFQSQNIDTAQAMDELGVRPAYEEAVATGEPIKIPLAAFVDKLVGTKHYAGLADDVKFDPEGWTANERKARQEDVAQGFKQVEDQAQAAVKDDADLRASYDGVFSDVKSKLERANPGNFSTEQWSKRADAEARVVASLAVARAKKRGISVEDAYATIRHEIQGPGDVSATEGDTSFDFGAAAPELKAVREEAGKAQQLADLATQGGLTPVMDAIRTMGGIDPESAKKYGWLVEIPDMEHFGLVKKDGESLDNVAANLASGGVIPENDSNLMADALREEALKISNFRAEHGEEAYQALRRKRGLLAQGEPPADGSAPRGPEGAGEPVRSSSDISVDPKIENVKTRADDWLAKEAAARGMELNDKFIEQFAAYVHRGINALAGSLSRKMQEFKTNEEKMAFLESKASADVQREAANLREKMSSLKDAYPDVVKNTPHDPAEEAKVLEGFKDIQGRPDRLFQGQAAAAPAPIFYSKLQRSIEAKLPEKATVGQVEAILRDSNKEERKWSGVDDFLREAKDGKINKGELLDFMRANELQLREVDLVSADALNAEQKALVEIPESKRTPDQQRRLADLIGRGMGSEAIAQRMTTIEHELGSMGYDIESDPTGTPGDITLHKSETGDFLNPEDVPEAVGRLAGEFADLDRRRDLVSVAPKGAARYHEYTLPGGSNYHELLLTMPVKPKSSLADFTRQYRERFPDSRADDGMLRDYWEAGNTVPEAGKTSSKRDPAIFRSSHFDAPNILAHVRFDDRVDAQGKKVLFLEEIQSDWHQKGRRDGYRVENPTQEDAKAFFAIKDDAWAKMDPETRQNFVDEMKSGEKHVTEGTVPDAPFKKTWQEFALKRMIRYAAENGYDKVGWTTGEQQADRYDLSKQVDAVSALRYDDGTYSIRAKPVGSQHWNVVAQNAREVELPGMIGKDLAEKISSQSKGDIEYRGLALKVGGEGMKGFYDHILPSFANKFGKRFGAKVEEAQVPIGDGKATALEMRNGDPGGDWAARQGKSVAVHALELTPALKRAALEEGLPLFQGEGKGARGFYEPENRVIGLMRSADESTYLHEVAHIWLDTEHEYITSGKADERSMGDWKTLGDWLGVKDGQAQLTRDQQEQFARGFEAYVREGKAPTDELRGVFSRLRTWLTRIYRSAKSLNVELSDPVRGVMDRMLASEDEISRASEEVGYQSSEIEGLDGVAPEAKQRVRTLQERARSIAEETLLREQMKEIKDQSREFMAQERERVTARETKAVDELPIYRSIDYLDDSLGKGADAKKAARAFLDGKLKDEHIKDFEVTAEVNGFADGRDLAEKILAAAPRSEEVARRVKAEMGSYADLRNTGLIRERAMSAIHNLRKTELLALERQVLEDLTRNKEISAEVARRRRADAGAEAAAAKDQARKLLEAKSIGEAQSFRPYVTAERNAAIRVTKALARETPDYAAAAAAKREQLLNHALYIEAVHNRDEISSALDFLGKFQGRGRNLLDMPYGFVSQVDGLLRRFGFPTAPEGDAQTLAAIAEDMARKGEAPDEIANATGLKKGDGGRWVPETLIDLLRRVNEEYYAMTLPDDVVTGARASSRDMTLGELRLVRETVEAIASVGKGYTRFLSDFIKGDIKEAAAEFRASVESLIGTPYAEKLTIGSMRDDSLLSKIKDTVDVVASFPDAIAPELVNLLTLCAYLDGGKEDGPAHQYIYRVLKRAEDGKLSRYEKMTKEINDIFARHFSPEELAAYKTDKVYIPEIGKYLTKEQILAVRLNWGNEGNRDRIMRFGLDGRTRLEEVQIRAILDTITKEGHDLAQEIHDHLDTYWPEVAKLEMKVNGVEPKRVDPLPIETRYGSYRGGYYPIFYDFNLSSEAYKNAERMNALYKEYSTAAAHTEQGHLQLRAPAVNRGLRLSIDVLFNHLENVVHDLEYRAAVIDVNRFLKQRDVRTAIDNAIGVRGTRAFDKALQDVASDQGEFLGWWEQKVRWFRFGATYSTLGLRVFTLPMDLTGNIINGIWEIGPTRLRKAMTAFAADPKGIKEFVDANSERMRHRGLLRDRDVMDIARKWSGRESAITTFAFVLQSVADEAISYPLWHETYKRALSEYGHEKARDIADETITRTVGSGSRLDQVGAQKGSEWKKITSMYYSWMSMMFNRAWLDGKLSGLEYSKGNTGAAIATAAKATFFAWGLQSLNENFWRELFRNAQSQDDEGRKRRVAGRILQQPFGYLWLARDIGGYFFDKALGKSTANFRLSPLESSLETLLDPGARALNIAFSDNKQYDEKFGETVAKSASVALGYPQSTNAVAFNLWDWMQGNGELTWRDFVTRRTKK